MSATYWAAFVCYGIVLLFGILIGATYLFRSTFMPYHQQALGKSWQQLDQNLQVLLLALMRSVGGGSLAASAGAAVMLAIPFRAQESWAKYTLPVIGLVITVSALYATILVRSRTGARTPVVPNAIAVGLLVIGFALSMI